MTLFVYQICECEGLQETIASLKQQLSDALESKNLSPLASYSQRISEIKSFHAQHQVDNSIAKLQDSNELKSQVCLQIV